MAVFKFMEKSITKNIRRICREKMITILGSLEWTNTGEGHVCSIDPDTKDPIIVIVSCVGVLTDGTVVKLPEERGQLFALHYVGIDPINPDTPKVAMQPFPINPSIFDPVIRPDGSVSWKKSIKKYNNRNGSTRIRMIAGYLDLKKEYKKYSDTIGFHGFTDPQENRTVIDSVPSYISKNEKGLAVKW